ncbi:hypothetical protein [Streptomyces sp. NPDC060194]|uniref:hypothetical protein n=1 Tax=Streptomyces sp. NPDC060194 TaxID=3347069 RepID=UPI00365BA130
MCLTAAVTAGGCVTVHGERAVVPATTEAEAAEALAAFTEAYNAADRAFDPALDAGRVTGPLGAINQAGLRAKRAASPGGNPRHSPLALTDARFTVPAQAGWPKFFLADTDSNRDRDGDPRLDNRWLLVFTRGGADQLWEVTYLAVLTPDEVPAFRTSSGRAEPVAPDGGGLAARPASLSERYAAYLRDGRGPFATGSHTSEWRALRERTARRPGRTTQYADQPLTDASYAPLGLRTEDGGALVFFSSRHYEKQTAAPGVPLRIQPEVRSLLTGGAARTSVTLEQVSGQAALVPPAGGGPVDVVARLQGLTGARGG